MVTAVQPAKREQPEEAAMPVVDAAAVTHAAAVSPANDVVPTVPGVDSMDFLRDNRIHVKDGSLFLSPYLVVHPRELAPENEAKLKQKLQLTYSVNNPSFYESSERLAIALNLGQLIPVSLDAKHSQLMESIKKYNAQVDGGADADLAKLTHDKQHPFAAIVRDTVEKPTRDPVGIETLKNGLSIYLLMRERLTNLGYRNALSTYVTRSKTPDQVLTDLGEKIGVTPIQVREAALNGGVEGVGQLLGLDAAYVKDVKAFTEYAATQDFSLNAIEHWHLGRHLLGVAAPMAEKISAGIAAHIDKTIATCRDAVHHLFEVPEPVKIEEQRVAQALNLVDPIQRALMYKLGYEICFTPEVMADGIAKYNGIYGLHRKAANDLRDVNGTYRIYFSGRGDLKGSMRTLVHEVAHNLWPEQFSAEEVQKIDAYAKSDAQHFAKWQSVVNEPANFVKFEAFVKAYQAGNDAEKAAVMASTNEWLAPHGVTVDGLFPYLRDAHDFQYMVQFANDTLNVEGARYARSGYNSPHERFREVISRFAELKQVEYKADPQLLHFLAPGLDQIWEAHYIPHLKRVYQQLATTPVASKEEVSARSLPSPANDTTASITPLPKVAQHPAPADACIADGAAPETTVDAASVVNERSLAAMNALSAMGVQPQR